MEIRKSFKGDLLCWGREKGPDLLREDQEEQLTVIFGIIANIYIIYICLYIHQ